MKLHTTVQVIILAASPLFVNASPMPSPKPPVGLPGYSTAIAEFAFSINNLNFTMNGTVQEVYNQLAFFSPHLLPALESSPSTSPNTPSTPLAISTLNKASILCCPLAGQPWDFAPAGRIDDGINYLNRINARINLGGRTCSRISCSWSSAIYFCNDNSNTISVASGYLASYARDVENSCSKEGGNQQNHYLVTCGQEFDTDRYNVIVRSDGC